MGTEDKTVMTRKEMKLQQSVSEEPEPVEENTVDVVEDDTDDE